MFLTELKKEEKEAFLELASLIAKIDGNHSIFEHSILNEYRNELNLKDYVIKGVPIEEILNVFTTERSKNIVLTEILRLIFSDGVYHDYEKDSVRLIKNHFGFAANEYESMKDWVAKIKELANYPENV